MSQSIASELSGVDLGDRRLNKRLVKIGEALSRNPEESICSAIGSFHDCKAAYRFFANKKVSPDLISSSHVTCSMERASQSDESLLVLHDTTDLIYSKFKATKGLSSLMTKPGMSRGLQGMMLHNSFLLEESGTPLGIIKQSYFNHEDYRKERGQIEKNIQGANKLYPIEKKASWRWIKHLIDTEDNCRSLKKQVIHVADREGDIYEFLQTSQTIAADYVIRAKGERRVHLGLKSSRDTTTITHSFSGVKELGQMVIEVLGGNGQRIEHHMSVKAMEVVLHPPQRRADSDRIGKLVPISVGVVEARSTTDNNLSWRLLTNLDCLNFENAIRLVNIYKTRWTIESYHRVLKSGFKIESARLASRSRLENFCTLVSILAWRVMWLYLASRKTSKIPCTRILSNQELRVIAISKHCKNKNIMLMEAHEAVLVIAKLGGFLNRNSDGPPGMTAIWKGWKALYERIEFLEELTYG